ncbi:alpha/beta fold hydrolase [Paenibacillus sp. MCAF9]|uniref:alpha/beta fold hydrolase n=1 Tax=Paenibacillus sp. MCAF9 TaxID=3233046 RepID=UPI003F98B8D8
MIESKIASNQDVQIHYLDSKPDADQKLTPLIICPGLSETAEEYEDLLLYLLPRRAIVLSFRGRGQSDTPFNHYDLKDHIADLSAVVEAAAVDRFHLMGYSRGVSYALGYAQTNEHNLESLILEDYPAEHKQMSAEWRHDYIFNYLKPMKREEKIREQAVIGIERDSSQLQLDVKLKLPVLVMRGMLEGSLLSDAELIHYKQLFSNITVKEFFESAHNIRGTEKEELYQTIEQFIKHR